VYTNACNGESTSPLGGHMQQVTDGLQFPEGPVAMADGSVVVVEIRRGTLTRVSPDGRSEIVAELGGGPNGAAIGPDGAMYVCNNGNAWEWQPGERSLPAGPVPDYRGGSIQRVDLRTGRFTTLYDSCDGKPLNSPTSFSIAPVGSGSPRSDTSTERAAVSAPCITRGPMARE
jgi:sugar lactone lactonase YvrE